MTKGTLQFVPDTHAVVPKEPTLGMTTALGRAWLDYASNDQQLAAAIKAAPQLTTPPVLRWEQDSEMEDRWVLLLYWAIIAVAHDNGWEAMYVDSGQIKRNPEQARRAAEKALGIPFEVEEV